MENYNRITEICEDISANIDNLLKKFDSLDKEDNLKFINILIKRINDKATLENLDHLNCVAAFQKVAKYLEEAKSALQDGKVQCCRDLIEEAWDLSNAIEGTVKSTGRTDYKFC